MKLTYFLLRENLLVSSIWDFLCHHPSLVFLNQSHPSVKCFPTGTPSPSSWGPCFFYLCVCRD